MFSELSEAEISRRLVAGLQLVDERDCAADWLTAPSWPAAVLIPFLKTEGGWYLLYTRRTDRVEHHKGQVAFPGGRRDPEDLSPTATALRETCEEIGVNPLDVQILGSLDRLLTVTGYCVTPIVGVIPWPYELRLAEEEVSRAFTIPLDWLSDPSHHRTNIRLLQGVNGSVAHETIYFQEYDGELLWGVSAQITVNLLCVLGIHA